MGNLINISHNNGQFDQHFIHIKQYARWCPARAGAEVLNTGHGYRKSMAYRKVFVMQKQGNVEVARCTNELANGCEMPMKWMIRVQLSEWTSEPMNWWTIESVKQWVTDFISTTKCTHANTHTHIYIFIYLLAPIYICIFHIDIKKGSCSLIHTHSCIHQYLQLITWITPYLYVFTY